MGTVHFSLLFPYSMLTQTCASATFWLAWVLYSFVLHNLMRTSSLSLSKLMQFSLQVQHIFLLACLWEPALGCTFASKPKQNKEWPLIFLIQIQETIGRSIPSFSKYFPSGQVLLCQKHLSGGFPRELGEITDMWPLTSWSKGWEFRIPHPLRAQCLLPLWGSSKETSLLCADTSNEIYRMV